jgi:hypothetical protein
MLEALADLHAQQAAIRQAQAVALPAHVRLELAAVEARFAPELAAVASELALVESQVRSAVLKHGQSVRGHRFHAVYVPGKAHWDSDMLAGYALSHAEILLCCEMGKPSVTLRKVGDSPPVHR